MRADAARARMSTEPVSRHQNPDAASLPSGINAGGVGGRIDTTVIEVALEQSCSALIALEAGLASVNAIPGEHEEAETGLRTAIESVRLVVASLRALLPGQQAPPLAFGFVTRGRRGSR